MRTKAALVWTVVAPLEAVVEVTNGEDCCEVETFGDPLLFEGVVAVVSIPTDEVVDILFGNPKHEQTDVMSGAKSPLHFPLKPHGAID